MIFNLFRHKKKVDTSRTYEAREVSDDEIKNMTRLKGKSLVKKDLDDLNRMFGELKDKCNNGCE